MWPELDEQTGIRKSMDKCLLSGPRTLLPQTPFFFFKPRLQFGGTRLLCQHSGQSASRGSWQDPLEKGWSWELIALWKTETWVSEVQGLPGLQAQFKVSLGNLGSSCSQNKTQTGDRLEQEPRGQENLLPASGSQHPHGSLTIANPIPGHLTSMGTEHTCSIYTYMQGQHSYT